METNAGHLFQLLNRQISKFEIPSRMSSLQGGLQVWKSEKREVQILDSLNCPDIHVGEK